MHKSYALNILWVFLLIGYSQSSKPNFIIMFMDDMGWGDLGCYGNPSMETPNLDKMASEGMLFTDFYTGSAICSPSRASILTGRLPIRNGFYTTNKKARNSYTPQQVLGGIPDSEVLFSEVLKSAGYQNKIIGKWHLGHLPQYLPLHHGFHEWLGAPNCHYKYNDKTIPNIPLYRNNEMIGRFYDDIKIDHEKGVANLTQWYTEEALEFIERKHKAKEAFMLYWTPDATHTPLYASTKFRGKSKRGLYGDAVMELDHGVGQILNKLRELNIHKNTFVFFSSDNGAATYAFTEGGSNGPFLCGKQTTFEGGYRQPALAWWPERIPAGHIYRKPGNLMDIYLTILDMADIPSPKNITFDGISIKDVMYGKPKQTTERPVFYYRGDTLFKVRYGDYKAHLYTWGTPKDSQMMGYNYCPGQYIANVTTEEMVSYINEPLLFHLGRDPGEKFFIKPSSQEYKDIIGDIMKVVSEHKKNVKFSKPQLNICDMAAQNWAPPGCEKINRCLKVPPSNPYKCAWPY